MISLGMESLVSKAGRMSSASLEIRAERDCGRVGKRLQGKCESRQWKEILGDQYRT